MQIHLEPETEVRPQLDLNLHSTERKCINAICFLERVYSVCAYKIDVYRPISTCFVSAIAKSFAASRLVRTLAGDSRNTLQTWLD
jgi:hypothetical protein